MRLVRKRTLWLPTWQGSVAILMVLALLLFFFITRIHSFLAKTERVNAEILVVEGWIPDYALDVAFKEFKDGDYRYLCTTGGPISHGSYLRSFENWALLAASTLRRQGVSAQELIIASTPPDRRNRTFASAKALKKEFVVRNIAPKAFNILTLSTHARRTWIIYQKVFPREVDIGVISVRSKDYAADRWWLSSSGIKAVLTEFIGWFTARLLNSSASIEADQQ